MEILFQLLLKGCTIEAAGARFKRGAPISFSCCWKDVRLKLNLCKQRNGPFEFQLLLKGCTIEAVRVCLQTQRLNVSVVVERMYDWSNGSTKCGTSPKKFQLLLKGCTIEAGIPSAWRKDRNLVSVVVERMYDWSPSIISPVPRTKLVSVVVERMYDWSTTSGAYIGKITGFSCCWKDVRLKQVDVSLITG